MSFHKVKEAISSEKVKYGLKWVLLSTVVGGVIGCIAILFEIALVELTKAVELLTFGIILVLPIIGLLLSGLITGNVAPEARGHGTDAIIHAYHHEWGIVRGRVIAAKLTASIATIGFGGSAGREGPLVQMGGGVSSMIGQEINLSLRERKTLVLCGMSASFGAIFAAPLSGAIFACEVVFRDEFEYINILPCAISSVVGFLTYKTIFSLLGYSPLIDIPPISYAFDWPHIFIFLGVGLVCGLVGLLYVKLFYFIDRKAEGWKKPDWLKTALGGIVVSLLALLFMIFAIHEGDINNTVLILGMGWHLINLIGTDPLTFSLLFLVLLLIFKILTTCVTIGSGGSGGVVAPSIVMGGLLGGIIATLLGPFISFDMRVIIVVSSIVLFASVAHIPLTGMLLTGEMYGLPLIVPALLASVIGSWVASGDSIYHSSLVSREETLRIYKKFKEIK
ncbi:MAG TPA: chloride channel protein [Candidatus Deferrimicrobium sp.]|nr:chloride channel protein [Candidatus Deferrimicrobium sp.]